MSDFILSIAFVITAAAGLGFIAIGIRSMLDARRQKQATSNRLTDIIRRAS